MIYGGNVDDILNTKGLTQINDIDAISTLINKVLDDNLNVVEDYKNGNERALKYLIGQVMKESKGQANPKILNDALILEVNKR
jgi:aspartyl-tRNA(Asn)/glutamyl-tRNA(Gln) amidotransferase subunit B